MPRAGAPSCANIHRVMGAALIAAIAGAAACAHARSDAPGDATGSGHDAATAVDACASCVEVYVATTGADTNPGTMTEPLATVAAGIALAAQATTPRPVFVATGSYTGSIQMVAGVDVTGGFDPTTWQRSGSAATELSGPSPVVTFESITTPTVLANFTILAADATSAGASSIAVVIDSSQMVVLQDDLIQAGSGGSGSDG